jgi:hypothetical protein
MHSCDVINTEDAVTLLQLLRNSNALGLVCAPSYCICLHVVCTSFCIVPFMYSLMCKVYFHQVNTQLQ